MEMQINKIYEHVIKYVYYIFICYTFYVIFVIWFNNSQFSNCHTHHNHLFGRTLPVTKNPLTPPNQAPITALTRAQIAAGLELPKNLIVATCPPQSTGGGTGCPPVVGTNGDDSYNCSCCTRCFCLWYCW